MTSMKVPNSPMCMVVVVGTSASAPYRSVRIVIVLVVIQFNQRADQAILSVESDMLRTYHKDV